MGTCLQLTRRCVCTARCRPRSVSCSTIGSVGGCAAGRPPPTSAPRVRAGSARRSPLSRRYVHGHARTCPPHAHARVCILTRRAVHVCVACAPPARAGEGVARVVAAQRPARRAARSARKRRAPVALPGARQEPQQLGRGHGAAARASRRRARAARGAPAAGDEPVDGRDERLGRGRGARAEAGAPRAQLPIGRRPAAAPRAQQPPRARRHATRRLARAGPAAASRGAAGATSVGGRDGRPRRSRPTECRPRRTACCSRGERTRCWPPRGSSSRRCKLP